MAQASVILGGTSLGRLRSLISSCIVSSILTPPNSRVIKFPMAIRAKQNQIINSMNRTQETISSLSPATKRYEKIGHAEIHSLIMVEKGKSAFDVAHRNYKKWSKHFLRDVLYYHKNGYVISRPKLFAMGKPIWRDGRQGWFIQMAVGNILELLTCLPFKLDFIAFCRNGDDNMRVVEWDAFMKKIGAIHVPKAMQVNVGR